MENTTKIKKAIRAKKVREARKKLHSVPNELKRLIVLTLKSMMITLNSMMPTLKPKLLN
jgi:hypothetical protein